MAVLIVGGGIVGMVASFILAKRAKKVILVEAAPYLGGLLRGPSFNGCHFDHGSHLIASTGVPEIDNFLFSGLAEDQFNLFSGHDADRSGSFSALGWNEDTSFVDVRPEGIAADIVEWRRSNKVAPAVRSAHEELQSLYGQTASPFFGKILGAVFGRNPRKLSAHAVKLLALHRAVFMSDADIESCPDVVKIGPVLAHPERAKFNLRAAPKTRSIYPKHRGLSKAIDSYEIMLKEAGVHVLKSATLECFGKDFIARSSTTEQTILNPMVLWTAGVPSAANLFLNKRYEAAPSDRVCWIAHVQLSRNLRRLTNYYYFIRHPNLQSYRLTNYSALTLDESDHAYTLEITAPKSLSEVDMNELVKSELLSMGLIKSSHDVSFLRLSRLNYSFLNATVDFEIWCESIVQELKGQVPVFGPWSSRGMFFTGDCLRDLYARLPT